MARLSCAFILSALSATSASGGAAYCADWLTAPCATQASLTTSGPNFTLSNGIVSRTLTLDASGTLYTTSLQSLASGAEKLKAVVAEAMFSANGAPLFVGGRGPTPDGGARLTFVGARSSRAPLAGEFSFTPGARGSRPAKPWPPAGARAEFDHTVPCAAVGAGAGTLNATIVYELYDGTSSFGKRVLLSHTCDAPLYVFNATVGLLALVGDGVVDFHTDPSVAEGALVSADAPPGFVVWASRFLPIAQTHVHDAALPLFGPGLSAFARDTPFESYLCVEVVHDGQRDDSAHPHGMSQYGLESARMYRTLAPQIEQNPVAGHAMCVGGHDLPHGDPRAGSWCYDANGTAGLEAYIDQAIALGFELVTVSLNMNSTWRSQIGTEFQSAENITWFKALVDRGRAGGVELGVYQLLMNARSATGLNEAAPSDATLLPNVWFDDQDLAAPLGTGLPCHNFGIESCRGGAGCCSLCSATSFYDDMEASMLNFWDSTGMTAIEQDGGDSDTPCANASHAHHHGLNDSIWMKYNRAHGTYKSYTKRGGFIQGSGHVLEGGQSKVVGGYDEMTFSLPRWTWINRQRERMIADPQGRDRGVPNALRYYVAPFTPFHPAQVLPGATTWSSVTGLESTATLEPLEEHVLELEWTLSQTFGTGIFTNLRGVRLAGGPLSTAAVTKWVTWFKKYRTILTADFATLLVSTTCWGSAATQPTSTCNVSGADAILHWAPAGFYGDINERALAVVWNPLNATIANLSLTLPLYYAGLQSPQSVRVRQEEGPETVMQLDANNTVTTSLSMPPLSITWLVVEAA